MDNKIALLSLASDLKRVCLGLERGAFSMAQRFEEEALKRKEEVDIAKVDGYIAKLLERLEKDLKSEEKERKAEAALMYSTLFQNYATKKL